MKYTCGHCGQSVPDHLLRQVGSEVTARCPACDTSLVAPVKPVVIWCVLSALVGLGWVFRELATPASPIWWILAVLTLALMIGLLRSFSSSRTLLVQLPPA